jgi:hypothetical protein
MPVVSVLERLWYYLSFTQLSLWHRNLASFLHIPLCFKEWHLAHPQALAEPSISTLIQDVTERLDSEIFANLSGRISFFQHFCILIAMIIDVDPRLRCKSGDIYWLMQILEEDSCDALAIISMLFAYASTSVELLTTVQVAEIRNEPEITWRKRAQIGKVLGALKVGNRWLLERRTLQAMGMMEDEVNINPDNI